MIKINVADPMQGSFYARSVENAWRGHGPRAVPACYADYAEAADFEIDVDSGWERENSLAHMDLARRRIRYTRRYAGDLSLKTHLHELGHVFSFNEMSKPLSTQKEFRDAYAADRAELDSALIAENSYYLSYRRPDRGLFVSLLFGRMLAREEAFAELFAGRVLKGSDARNDFGLGWLMPRSAAVVGRFHDQVFGMTAPLIGPDGRRTVVPVSPALQL